MALFMLRQQVKYIDYTDSQWHGSIGSNAGIHALSQKNQYNFIIVFRDKLILSYL